MTLSQMLTLLAPHMGTDSETATYAQCMHLCTDSPALAVLLEAYRESWHRSQRRPAPPLDYPAI